MQLKDKVVIATGGASGIGTAITRTLAQERAVPVILERDTAAPESLRAVLTFDASLSLSIQIDPCSVASERTLSVAKRLSAFVEYSGVNDSVGLEKVGPEEFAALLSRNLLPNNFCAGPKEAWRKYKNRRLPAGHGHRRRGGFRPRYGSDL